MGKTVKFSYKWANGIFSTILHDVLQVCLLVLLFDVGCLEKNLLVDLPEVSDTTRRLRDFPVQPQAALQVLLAARPAFHLVLSPAVQEFHLSRTSMQGALLNRGGNTVLIF